MTPEQCQEIIRGQGMCGELSPDRKRACILIGEHTHDWTVADMRTPYDDGGFPVPSGVLMRKPIRCSEDGDENESESDDPIDPPLFAIAASAGSCDGCGLPIAVGEPVHHYGEVTVHAVCPGDIGHNDDDEDRR